MADTTISQLGVGTPTTSIVVPWSDGITTYKARLSALITAQGDMGTGAIQLPGGTDAQRPTAVEGQIRYNTGAKTVEFYNGSRWVTISISLIAEVLIVAGGGSGGNRYYAGGGGAGGLIYYPSMILGSGNYSVVVGLGGVATSSGVTVRGINGGNSSFNNLLVYGGGGGGSGASGGGGILPNSGGSGGGGSLYTASQTGADGISGQGNKGGNGAGYPGGLASGGGGGGGGAGGAGGNSTSSVAGAGGSGLQYSITGIARFYAGGGGGAAYTGIGGTGGSGVGGNGANVDSFNNGNAVQNTGSGGGGSSYSENGGFPGSGANGVVIIAYPGSQAAATGGTISTTSRPGYVVHTFTNPGGTFSF